MSIGVRAVAWGTGFILFLITALGWTSARAWAEPANSLFSQEDIASGRFVEIKKRLRERKFGLQLQGRSAPRPNDLARNLVDQFKYDNFAEIHQAGLASAQLAESPWSDDYWPLYKGVIANRYADHNFPSSSDWKVNYDYLMEGTNSSSVDRLSPAEKYDLLVGDDEKTLTKSMLDEGKYYYDSTGKVESWMGICHGWAPASYMLPRPTHSMVAMAADGKTKITFFPSDIKALASLLWAKADTKSRFISGRCNERRPELDPAGRPVDPECLDTNPATWHLSIVNQIGVSKRGFVIDATYDYEVWNQPVIGYRYTLFNPKTNADAQSLQDAKVELDQFQEDPYRKFRASEAVAVVGVIMETTYGVEARPVQSDTDGPQNDRTVTARYVYDLELDEKDRIVGGEWHNLRHPDFLWTPVPGAVAKSVGDLNLDKAGESSGWGGMDPIPTKWKTVAPRTSSHGQPLNRIVQALITLSRSGT